MTINLAPLVQEHALKLEQLKGKVIAVDCYNALYQFVRTMPILTDRLGRYTSHLVGLFNRTTRLMALGLKLCYVIDGGFPSLGKQKRIMDQPVKPRATATFTEGMIEEVKLLLEGLGLPVVQAPSEGEAQAAFMASKKDVWAVATQDYDALVFGAPRMVKNLTFAKTRRWPSGKYALIGTYLIELKELLKTNGINLSQLRALAVLLGSDFSPGIKGIGPKRGLKLLKKHRSFDAMFREAGWNKPYSWKEVYDCISTMPVTKRYRLKWKSINWEQVISILVEKHDFNESRIRKALERAWSSKQ